MTQLINCPNCNSYRPRDLVMRDAGCDRCEGRDYEEQMEHLREELHAQFAAYQAARLRQENAPPDPAKYR